MIADTYHAHLVLAVGKKLGSGGWTDSLTLADAENVAKVIDWTKFQRTGRLGPRRRLRDGGFTRVKPKTASIVEILPQALSD